MDQNFAACRRLPTRDQIEERGLAGAIWPNHGVSLTIRNREIQIGDDFQPTEGLSQIPDFECAHRHFPTSVRRVPRMPPRKKATTNMKKMPKNRLYSSVIKLSACFTTTKTAAPMNGPMITLAPPMITINTPSPLTCQLIESGLTKYVHCACSIPPTPPHTSESTNAPIL